ncbi:IclR family transcriptional regulator [Clostridium sp.]
MKEKEQKYSAPAVERVLDILEMMARENRSFTVTEVSSILKISINSAFRIFKELENKHYVVKDMLDSSYELTPKLYYLGSSIKSRITLIKTAQPFIKHINNISGETVLLTIFGENYSTLVVDQLESPQPIKFLSTVGLFYDSYNSAMGKAMLSTLENDELLRYTQGMEFIPKTPSTIIDKEKFLNEIREIAKTGVAYDKEEAVQGLSCIACPIFSAGKVLKGAVGISSVSFRITAKKKQEFAELIKAETTKLSRTLGYEI